MMSLLDFILSQPSFTETRIPSLYSDFRRLKDSNPDGYEANVNVWKIALINATRTLVPKTDKEDGSAGSAGSVVRDDVLVIHSGSKLLDSLSSAKWGRPLGLSAVFVRESFSSAFCMKMFSKDQHTNWYTGRASSAT